MIQKLKYLVIHCTDTPEGRVVTKEDIIRWHTTPKEKGGRGWSRVGYRDEIMLDGSLVNLVPFNSDDNVDAFEITNGVLGMNGNSQHLVYVGGKDKTNKIAKDTRTPAQKSTLELVIKYTILRYPDIQVLGHYQAETANGKTCPNFDVPACLRAMGVAEKNIYQGTLKSAA